LGNVRGAPLQVGKNFILSGGDGDDSGDVRCWWWFLLVVVVGGGDGGL
jgi:hypothetical protein